MLKYYLLKAHRNLKNSKNKSNMINIELKIRLIKNFDVQIDNTEAKTGTLEPH